MPVETETEKAAEILAASEHAVVLTGAGHSTPSGIPDFRSPESGLWTKADSMVVASIDGFRRNPQAFYDWIRPLARQMMEAQPNAAHIALADLEEAGLIKCIITQNIDALHHKAGSRNVLELHGSVRQATCTHCRKKVPSTEIWPAFVVGGALSRCPTCDGVLKPDVVLFGELLPVATLLSAQAEAERCDVMLVAGSSLEVYPAAELPMRATRHGAELILVNFEPTEMDAHAAVVIREDVAVVLPQVAARVKELRGSA